MPNIKCTVDNCYYHGANNFCTANEIEVAKNFNVAKTDLEAGSFGKGSANSNQTKCVTFKVKNS